MHQFILIFGVVWLAVISPGADFAMVSRVSFMHGRVAGLYVGLGIASACWIHVFYAIFGLTLLERWFPNLLDVIRFAGAAYLVYLGFTVAFAKPSASNPDQQDLPLTRVKAFFTGVLTNGLNPKTSIFVVSLYAQAIGPNAGMTSQLAYGVLIVLSHLIWFSLVAIFLSRPEVRRHVLARQRVINGVIGCVLVALGLVLAFADLSH